MSRNSTWPFTPEQVLINRCAMSDLPRTYGPTKLLRVETGYFVAGAVWQKICGIWSCVHCAPILHWMKGMNVDAAKVALLKMRASWSWTPVRPGASHSGLASGG